MHIANAALRAPLDRNLHAKYDRYGAIVGEAQRLTASGRSVTVVTSNRGLGVRVTDAGGAVRGTRCLLDQLGA